MAPAARSGACLVPDLGPKALLFGGGYDDTWEWDGSAWSELTSAGPGARYGAACSFADGVVVLFGGTLGPTLFNDTWTWDGAAWSEASPGVAPSARYGAAAATLDGKIVLFGGTNGTAQLSDTWVWDGTTWSMLPAGAAPSARSGAAIGTL